MGRTSRTAGLEPGGGGATGGGDDGLGIDYLTSRGGGSPLPDGAASALSRAYGEDLSTVRVHSDSHADMAARGLGAQAFATGEDIFLSQGLDTRSEHGQFVLAHEVAHVVQSRGGGGDSSVQAFREGADHDAGAERAADDAAEAALAGRKVSIARAPGGIRCFGAGTVKRSDKANAQGNYFTVEPGGHAYLTTQALQEMGLTHDQAVMGYQGNWMRDLSQAHTPGILTKAVGAANLNAILQVLSIKEFGRGFDPKEFGTYDPVEHIDNPTDLRASDVYQQNDPNAIKGDTVVQVSKPDVAGVKSPTAGSENQGYATADPRYGQAAAGMNIVNGGSEKTTAFQVGSLGMPVYINTSIEWARTTLHKSANLGRSNPEGPREFGSGIHAIQDYYSHSNFLEIALNVLIREGKANLPKGTDPKARLDSHVHQNDPKAEGGVKSVNLKVKDLPGYDPSKHTKDGKPTGDREVMATGSFNLTDTMVSLLHVLKEKILDVNPFKEKGKGPSPLANACLDYMDMATPDSFNKTGQKLAGHLRPLANALESLGGTGADVVEGAGNTANKALDTANKINAFFGGDADYWDDTKKKVSGATTDQADKIREASKWLTNKADDLAKKQHILRDLYGWWSGVDLLAPVKAIARNIPVIGPKAVELIEKTEKTIRDEIQDALSAGWTKATKEIIGKLQGIIDEVTKHTNLKQKKDRGKDPKEDPNAGFIGKIQQKVGEGQAFIERAFGGVGDLYTEDGKPTNGIAPQDYTPPSHSEVAKDHHEKEQAGTGEDHDHHDDEDGDAHAHGGDWLNGLAENLAGQASKKIGAKVKAVWDLVESQGDPESKKSAMAALDKEIDAHMCHPEDCRGTWEPSASKLLQNPEFVAAIVAKLKK